MVETEGWDQGADTQKYDDATGHDCCEFWIDVDGFDEDGWYVCNDLREVSV